MNTTTLRMAIFGGLAGALVMGLPTSSSAQHVDRSDFAPPQTKSHAHSPPVHNQTTHRADECWMGTDSDHPYYGYSTSCDTPKAIHAN